MQTLPLSNGCQGSPIGRGVLLRELLRELLQELLLPRPLLCLS